MRRPTPSRQQGFGLLILVVLTAMVTLMFVTGYSGLLTQQAANTLKATQERYLLETSKSLEAVWEQHAATLDAPGNTATSADILRMTGISPRHGSQLLLSNVLFSTVDNLTYRNAVIYVPTDSDTTNPPNLAHFLATGEFISCTNSSEPCDTRVFRVFSSLETQRKKSAETYFRLQKVAAKAQSYFKARMMADPEHAIDINYFRAPSGSCNATPAMDLGCSMDTYQPLHSQAARLMFGLSDEELYTAWNTPIEVSNLQDSSTTAVPFSMAFRARRPLGDYVIVRAVQQL